MLYFMNHLTWLLAHLENKLYDIVIVLEYKIF